MKHFNKILIFLFLSSITLVSCNDLLDVNSDRIVTTDEYQLNAANDSLYSMFGIFSKLEKLADSYVLAGELRADLMDVTDKSTSFLKELNDLTYSADNPYTSNIKDYYDVINNCNYVINTVDTTKVKGGQLVLKRVYAAAKAIRAWTYMQIALNFEKATYYEQPILSVEDADNIQKNAPQYSITELAPVLIKDLLPYKDVESLSLGSVYSHRIALSFFPIRFILGDLYLWKGDFENAANEYHDLMVDRNLVITTFYQSTRGVAEGLNPVFNGNLTLGWDRIFSSGSNEDLTNIVASNQYGQVFQLDSLNRNFMLKASEPAKKYWDSQVYYHSVKLDTLGDLRGFESYGKYDFVNLSVFKDSLISKYVYLNPKTTDEKTNRQIIIYRTALLYLRYAEAVNRLGKPNLALSVLKYGLNANTLSDQSKIPTSEIPSPLPNYMDFSNTIFANNIGIAARACGNVQLDVDTVSYQNRYKIPTMHYLDSIGVKDIKDSIVYKGYVENYMEDMIIKECALETAFEGNRFHDLMRIAIRRKDPSYLADKVAAKHKSNAAFIKQMLKEQKNWYLNK